MFNWLVDLTWTSPKCTHPELCFFDMYILWMCYSWSNAFTIYRLLCVYRKKWPGWAEQYEIQHYKFLPLPTYCFCHRKSHTHSQLFSFLLFFCLLPLALTWQVLMGVLFVHSELIGRLFESVTSVKVEDLRKCCCQSVGFPNSSDVCKSRKMLTRQRSSKVFFFLLIWNGLGICDWVLLTHPFWKKPCIYQC